MTKTRPELAPELFDLYDDLAHGAIDRRTFLERAARYASGGLGAVALLQLLSPDYALANQVSERDPRIRVEWIEYPSPKGHGSVRGYLARPLAASSVGASSLGGVVVVHENRGLNPYIQDVARRLASAGFVALAPDGLTSLGGYPGTDEEGKALQQTLDRNRLLEDFLAGWSRLRELLGGGARVGAVGFCFGGWVANMMAVRLPELAAAVPFYGTQPEASEVNQIRAPLMLHFAEEDPRVNAGWPAYQEALQGLGIRHWAHHYPGVRHGFHNDTTPRFDPQAAELAWARTLAFFRQHLAAGH